MDINKIKSKLPITPGINGRDEYLNSVVLVLLISIDGEYHLMFEKRASNIPQAGEICLPGGKREVNETPEATAIRETTEELGIPAKHINILGRLDTLIEPLGVIVDVVVGSTDITLEEIKINTAEVEKAFTVPLSYFKNTAPEQYKVMIKVHPSYIDENTDEEVILFPTQKLSIPEKYNNPWGKMYKKIYVYKTEGEIIWGITARVVKDFIGKI